MDRAILKEQLAHAERRFPKAKAISNVSVKLLLMLMVRVLRFAVVANVANDVLKFEELVRVQKAERDWLQRELLRYSSSGNGSRTTN